MSNLSRHFDASEAADLQSAWDAATPSTGFEPLPAGEYFCEIFKAELAVAGSGTRSVRLTFRVVEGAHANRRVWYDIWLTTRNIARAKADLPKLGIRGVTPEELGKLDRPLPGRFICRVKIALRKEDDGRQRNEVRDFTVERVEQIELDPFDPANLAAKVPSPPPTPKPAATPPAVLFDNPSLPEGQGR